MSSQAKSVSEGGYHTVQPYLMFESCAQAIEFYTKAFGAAERMRMPNPDGRIGHAEIVIGDSVICLADEAPQFEAYSAKHYGGSPASLLLYCENCDATYKQALDSGAISLREPPTSHMAIAWPE